MDGICWRKQQAAGWAVEASHLGCQSEIATWSSSSLSYLFRLHFPWANSPMSFLYSGLLLLWAAPCLSNLFSALLLLGNFSEALILGTACCVNNPFSLPLLLWATSSLHSLFPQPILLWTTFPQHLPATSSLNYFSELPLLCSHSSLHSAPQARLATTNCIPTGHRIGSQLKVYHPWRSSSTAFFHALDPIPQSMGGTKSGTVPAKSSSH